MSSRILITHSPLAKAVGAQSLEAHLAKFVRVVPACACILRPGPSSWPHEFPHLRLPTALWQGPWVIKLWKLRWPSCCALCSHVVAYSDQAQYHRHMSFHSLLTQGLCFNKRAKTSLVAQHLRLAFLSPSPHTPCATTAAGQVVVCYAHMWLHAHTKSEY